jgi:transposase InsO family protein
MLEAYLKQATEYIAADFASRIKDKGVTISFVRPSFKQRI